MSFKQAPTHTPYMEQKRVNQDGDIVVRDEGLVFAPYNPNNKEITLNDVQSILTAYGIHERPTNVSLYQRAFVHRSYTKRPTLENECAGISIAPRPEGCMELRTKSNERLEFLGDGVLELVTKYYLYRRFPKEDEGFMTEKKIALVKNEHIGRLACDMGLPEWLLLSRHAEEKNTRCNLKKLGCVFEAFIGALFLDFNRVKVNDESGWFDQLFVTGPGFQMAQKFVENVLEKHVDWVKLVSTDDNYKNILQVLLQKTFKTTPDYIEESLIDDQYQMGVYLRLGSALHEFDMTKDVTELAQFGGLEQILKAQTRTPKLLIRLGRSTHRIKKKAEQSACYEALATLGVQGFDRRSHARRRRSPPREQTPRAAVSAKP